LIKYNNINIFELYIITDTLGKACNSIGTQSIGAVCSSVGIQTIDDDVPCNNDGTQPGDDVPSYPEEKMDNSIEEAIHNEKGNKYIYI